MTAFIVWSACWTVEGGKISGYYTIGEATAGAEIGVEDARQIYVLRDPAVLEKLKESGKWEVGAEADIVVVKADAAADAETGDMIVYIFDAEGLNAGLDVNLLKVWKTGQS